MNKFGWIFFVSRRFASVDKSMKSSITTHLASLGICLGVMTLIVVISVMNGFQMSFIDSILEISSYHLRVSDVEAESQKDFLDFCKNEKQILSCTPFLESQALVSGRFGKQSAAIVRSIPEDVLSYDLGLKKEMKITSGSFDLTSHDGKDSIVLGTTLASALGVRIGSVVNLFALSGGSDVELLSDERVFVVAGIFHSGYAEINSSYAFISFDSGRKYFGESAKLLYGIKLQDYSFDNSILQELKQKFGKFKVESWKSFNKSFFGALRIEKNMLMLLVFLIFVVVCVNIFNGMRRLVFERRNEISILSALGGKNTLIQAIFIFRGFLTGAKGAVSGLILGLFIAINMGSIFTLISVISYNVRYFFALVFTPESASFIYENPMYLLYAKYPARIVMHEVLIITLFGVFSSLAASWFASRGILKLKVAEVLHDE